MKTINMRNLLLLVGLLALTGGAWAEGDVDMTFHGTLVEPPPCTINNDDQIEVDFGNRVGINKVDGVNYRTALNYQITCQDRGAHNWALTLSLTGSQAGFDNEALKTNMDNLGIRIYRDDIPFTPNQALEIDVNNPPRLEAVPVKQSGTTLTEGAFEAWATLRADYQ